MNDRSSVHHRPSRSGHKFKGTRVAVSLLAVGALTIGLTGAATVATAAPKPAPTPLQVAASYMKLPTKITQRIPLKTKPARGIRVGYMTNGTSATNMGTVRAKEVADLAGWIFHEIPVKSSSDGASIESGINSALVQGDQVIIGASGIDITLISNATRQRLLDAQVPFIVGQACPSIPIAPPFFAGPLLCANETAVGDALASWVAADSKGNGKVLWESISQFPLLVLTLTKFKESLAKYCPGCTVVVQDVTFTQYTQNQIPSIMVNRLRADPSIQYMFFDYGLLSKGILPALDAAGLLGKVKIGGKSIDPATQQALLNGQEDVWTAAAQGSLGYAYMDAAFRVLTKSSGISLNAIQPLQLVTNVNVRSIPDPYDVVPVDALAQFRKLWKI